MKKYRWGLVIAATVGGLVGAGGLVAAQTFLGNVKLIVNGQAFSGTFTPLEATNDLYVSLNQLSQAMGFTYVWKDNQLSIQTAGYTPPPGISNYPLQLKTSVKDASALTVLSAGLDGFNHAGHYAQFSVGFTYQGTRTQINTQKVTMDFTGMPVGSFRISEFSLQSGYKPAPGKPGNDYFFPSNAFAGQYFSRSIRVTADEPGTLQVTLADSSNASVSPQTLTLHFSY